MYKSVIRSMVIRAKHACPYNRNDTEKSVQVEVRDKVTETRTRSTAANATNDSNESDDETNATKVSNEKVMETTP